MTQLSVMVYKGTTPFLVQPACIAKCFQLGKEHLWVTLIIWDTKEDLSYKHKTINDKVDFLKPMCLPPTPPQPIPIKFSACLWQETYLENSSSDSMCLVKYSSVLTFYILFELVKRGNEKWNPDTWWCRMNKIVTNKAMKSRHSVLCVL